VLTDWNQRTRHISGGYILGYIDTYKFESYSIYVSKKKKMYGVRDDAWEVPLLDIKPLPIKHTKGKPINTPCPFKPWMNYDRLG